MIRVIRKKSLFERLSFSNFKLFAFLAILALVTGFTYYLTTEKVDIRQSASFTTNQTFDPGYVTLIVLAANQNELLKYQALGGEFKDLSFRTVKFNPIDEVEYFEQSNYRYFVTAASSDFIAHQNSGNLYNYDIETLKNLAQKTGFKGFYLHEMMTYRALDSAWDWNKARDSVDWAYVKQIVDIAKQNNKKVIWSEPTFAWKTMYESQPVMDLFAQWGPVVIPMYATNFTQEEINSSKEYATKVAQKYTLPLGQSHQGWYWQTSDGGTNPTRESSYNLALDGWNAGARYFQFEGNVNDFLWESPYMQGVRDFSDFTGKQYITPTSITTTVPTSTFVPTAKPCTPATVKSIVNGRWCWYFGTYRGATVTCSNGFVGQVGSTSKCEKETTLKAAAESLCKSKCN